MTWWQDLLFACRMLARKPGFTAAAVMSIALGIGANVTIFSLVRGMLLRPLPYPHPERLAMIYSVAPNRPQSSMPGSPRDFITWRDQSRSFELVGMAVQADRDFGSEDNGAPAERIQGWEFNTTTLEILGVKPILGRLFTPEEDKLFAQSAEVLLISYRLWQRRYGGDRNVIYREVRMDGVPNRIIGVMPPGFAFWYQVDYFKPNNMGTSALENPNRFVYSLARLKPEVSFPQAQAEMDALASQLAKTDPARFEGWGVRVEPLQEALYGGWLWNALFLMEGVVGFVLLIACANVAGLLMARASSRRVEIAVRAALGAGRRRILQQLLTESVLLAGLGGLCGLLLGWWGLRTLIALSPPWLPRVHEIRIDAAVLVFTAVASAVTGLIFGAMPAWRASKPDLVESLKESARGAATGLPRHRNVLVAAQFALALVLLTGAGLAMNSFIRIQSVDLGCDPNDVLTFVFRLPGNRVFKPAGTQDGVRYAEVDPQAAMLQDQICGRVRAVPGVLSAAGVSTRPLMGAYGIRFSLEGRPIPEDDAETEALTSALFVVTPNYFATMKVPFLRGRDFSDRDTPSSPWVAIVNETMAHRFWTNESAIGKQVTLLGLAKNAMPREIVGIVGNTPLSRRQTEPQPAIYISYNQQASPWIRQLGYNNLRRQMTYVVRSNGNARRLLPALMRTVAEIEPDLPLTEVSTVEEYLGEQVQTPRYYLTVLGVFATVAILLAAVGIYSLMAWSVAQRTREIGIRMALGARPRDVVVSVLRHALLLAAAGLILGLAGALALTRLIKSVLWGVSATDPATFAGAAAVLVAVAAIAALIPALRAARLDPSASLRHD